MENLFEKFDCGRLMLCGETKDLSSLEWKKHPSFEGVELKDIVTSEDTDGRFSYHLVRIAPDMKIGSHVHEKQTETHEVAGGSGILINEGRKLEYSAGTVSVINAGSEHEVIAGNDGLYLLAKFIPASC